MMHGPINVRPTVALGPATLPPRQRSPLHFQNQIQKNLSHLQTGQSYCAQHLILQISKLKSVEVLGCKLMM